MNGPADIAAIVDAELDAPVPAAARALSAAIRARHGRAVRAVLFYGSCLRSGSAEGVLDFYVLVEDYASFYGRSIWAWLNAAMPPNVFFIQIDSGGETVRAKYAVVSLADFARDNSERCFHTYFWSRFAQPCALSYVADETTRGQIRDALAGAVATFVRRTVPLLGARFRPRDLWVEAFTRTYRSELRSERPEIAPALYAANAARYDRVTELACRALPAYAGREITNGEAWILASTSPVERRHAVAAWLGRRVVGKFFSALRLLKGALTFDGGIDYALWKIERHSGIKADPSWKTRRFRRLAAGAELLRLYRQRAVR